MRQVIVNKEILPDVLQNFLPPSTDEVHIRRIGREIHLAPLGTWEDVDDDEELEDLEHFPDEDGIDYVTLGWGSLKDCPEMSLDKFMERKHADKLLDL